jgi:hypothetical protein
MWMIWYAIQVHLSNVGQQWHQEINVWIIETEAKLLAKLSIVGDLADT